MQVLRLNVEHIQAEFKIRSVMSMIHYIVEYL